MTAQGDTLGCHVPALQADKLILSNNLRQPEKEAPLPLPRSSKSAKRNLIQLLDMHRCARLVGFFASGTRVGRCRGREF